MSKNLEEARRWLSQAEADLKVARWDFEGQFWWEVCFKCQQAAEKALKALCFARGKRSILTHSLVEIARRCGEELQSGEFAAAFRKLDKYYIVARYPNGLPGLTPADYFDRAEASEALEFAARVLQFVQSKLSPSFQ